MFGNPYFSNNDRIIIHVGIIEENVVEIRFEVTTVD